VNATSVNSFTKVPPLSVAEPSLAIPAHVTDLTNDPTALANGLIAVAMRADPKGNIMRQDASGILVEQLRLDRFVSSGEQSVYREPLVAARSILKGMVNKGWITRWSFPMRVATRRRANTKGYIITVHGVDKLRQLQTIMPPEIMSKVKLHEIATYVPPSLPTNPEETLKKVESQLPEIQALIDEHEQIQQIVTDSDQLIAYFEARRRDVDAELAGYNQLRKDGMERLRTIQEKLRRLVG
jgi:hypothetical protein